MTAANQWTLETELCKLAGRSPVKEALHDWGLLNDQEAEFRLEEGREDWIRGGAETYIYRFAVLQEGAQRLDCILKACVAYSPGSDLESILEQWIERRQLLRESGVETPQLYAHGHGVIVEESIPFSLGERLHGGGKSAQESLAQQLSYLTGLLARHGFMPIQPFSDLRSRGTDVVVVDFGQDLGPPNVSKAPNKRLFDQLLNQLAVWDLNVSDNLRDELYVVFLRSSGIGTH